MYGTLISFCSEAFVFARSINSEQLSQLSNGLTFQLSSIHEILEIQTRLQQPVSVSKGDRLNNLTVIFPVYRIAASLIQSYESNVDHLCHILHLPTIRSLIKSFYLRITQNEFVLPSQAGLLLSIFAIAAYFYKPSSYSEVATAKEDCIRLSKVLSRGALDVLEYTRRNTSGTLEDVQASILMSFVAYHLDGFSARGRLLATAAASIARELRLHRLDAESELSNVENETNLRSLVDKEVKRRVFWQIVSTDWYAVFFSFINHSLLTSPRGYCPPSRVHKKACISFIRTMWVSIFLKTARTRTLF